ncbi:unnamed protein product, partial [Musa hybrid cultivar]
EQPARVGAPRATSQRSLLPRPLAPGPLGPTRAAEPPASAPRARPARPRRHPAREQPARVGAPRATSQCSLLPRPLAPGPLGPTRATSQRSLLPRPHATSASRRRSALRPRAQPIRCLGPSAPCAATRCLSSSADGATCCLGPMRGQPALAACCLGASAPCAATRFLGPKRSKQPAALAPRPHAQPTRCTLPRPSAPCTVRPPAPSFSAIRCRVHLSRASPADTSCYSAAWPSRTRLRGLPACVVLLGSSALRHPRSHLRGPSPPTPCSLAPCSRDRPARPAHLRRVPWPHVPETHWHGRPFCAEPLGHTLPPTCAGLLGPSSSNSPLCGQPACVVLLGSRLYANRDHACAANPPTLCSSALRLYATRDHTCAASPPASCSSALRLYATQDI